MSRARWAGGIVAAAGGALALDLGRLSALAPGGGAFGAALGTDAPLWGLGAMGLAHGAGSPVPPLWPLLLALPLHLGAPLVPTGQAAALALGALLPALGVALAGLAGAGGVRAAALGLALVLLPERTAWAVAIDANAATALGLLLTTGALAAALRAPDRPGRAAATAILAGLQPLVREGGLLVALAALLLLPLLLPRGWRWSLLLLATWWASPLLAGAWPGASPLDVPWGARGGTAMADLATGQGPLPLYVGEIPPAERAAYVADLRAGALHRVAAFHARRSWALGWDGWLLALAALPGLALALRRRGPALAALLPLATLAPCLLIWTQRRHVLLAAPALLLALALGPALPRVARAGALALAGGAALGWPARHATPGVEQQGEVIRGRGLVELAAQVEASGATLLGGPIQDVGLYAPRPRHEPDGSAADAWTAVVLPAHQARAWRAAGWQPQGPPVAELVVLRNPAGAEACPGGQPAPGTPYLSAGPVRARLVGCAAEAP